MATAKEARAAKSLKDIEEIEAVLDKAHAAATKAFLKFKKTATIAKDGYIMDTCGRADVVVFKPSYRLRTTLKSMGEIRRGLGGAWRVSNFTKRINEQSINANVVACRAACKVLQRLLPGEGEFYTTSWMD